MSEYAKKRGRQKTKKGNRIKIAKIKKFAVTRTKERNKQK